MWKEPLAKTRCLVPAVGWYEWKAVEQTFGRLAEVSHGRPASHGALPPDAAFAATLLILREFMHHLGFVTITVSC